MRSARGSRIRETPTRFPFIRPWGQQRWPSAVAPPRPTPPHPTPPRPATPRGHCPAALLSEIITICDSVLSVCCHVARVRISAAAPRVAHYKVRYVTRFAMGVVLHSGTRRTMTLLRISRLTATTRLAFSRYPSPSVLAMRRRR